MRAVKLPLGRLYNGLVDVIKMPLFSENRRSFPLSIQLNQDPRASRAYLLLYRIGDTILGFIEGVETPDTAFLAYYIKKIFTRQNIQEFFGTS
jgi:hypothetical protein